MNDIHGKHQLLQIKLFEIGMNNSTTVEHNVNNYIVKMFKETGNFPKVLTSQNHIIVQCNTLINLDND